jgi:hypothetical protein
MLCTVMWDAYASDERADVHSALETLLQSGSDWSRKGVYAYWDVNSHELLYLGLASDLPTRFAQHNALTSHGGGNKKNEIDAYCAGQPLLGFAVMVQGAAVDMQDAVAAINPTLATPAHEMVAVARR